MGNNSEEYPDGYLNGEVLKSFYSITGDDGDFTYTAGNERFPDNWYKRASPYTIPALSLDSTAMLLEHPEFASIGGNTGTVNSFTGIDPSNLTGGVFDASTLANGNNLMCYGLRLAVQEAPDLLSGLFTDVDSAVDKLGSAINSATDSLGCPTLNNVNMDQFSKYPGYANLKSDGTY